MTDRDPPNGGSTPQPSQEGAEDERVLAHIRAILGRLKSRMPKRPRDDQPRYAGC